MLKQITLTSDRVVVEGHFYGVVSESDRGEGVAVAVDVQLLAACPHQLTIAGDFNVHISLTALLSVHCTDTSRTYDTDTSLDL